jgi:cytochrome P450
MDPFVADLAHPEERQLLKEHYESWMLFSDDPRHTRLRAAVAPALSADVVASYRAPLDERAHALLDRGGTRIDVLRDYAIPLSVLALAKVLGMDEQRLGDAKQWAADIVDFINIDLDTAQALRTAQDIRDMSRLLDEMLDSEPVPGSVGHATVRAVRSGTFTRLDAEGMIGQMVSGVVGAQPYLVANAVIGLWTGRPDRAGRGPDSSVAALVEEALRFDPPFLLVPRTASADIEIDDVVIRTGDRVGFLLGALNRDGRQFPCPHLFDPGRAGRSHMSFGAGAHYCLGSNFVRMYSEVALSSLLARFPVAASSLSAGEHAPYFGLRAPSAVVLQRDPGAA